MKRIKLFALLPVCVALLLAGCGGGGDADSTASGAAEPPPAEASAPIGSAVISGTAMFEGDAPSPSRLRLDADCSALHEGPVMSENVVINDGKLANVFVYVKEGLGERTFAPPAEPVVIDQQGCIYHPHVFGIQVGQTLKILNSDPFLHNINAQAEVNRPFNFGMPKQGDERERSFRVPEVMVHIKCDVHPWMSAYAGVVAHPFFAVSGEDGSFSIEGLPAGEYVLEAWHEEFGTMTQTVTVTDGGAATADFTFTNAGAAD